MRSSGHLSLTEPIYILRNHANYIIITVIIRTQHPRTVPHNIILITLESILSTYTTGSREYNIINYYNSIIHISRLSDCNRHSPSIHNSQRLYLIIVAVYLPVAVGILNYFNDIARTTLCRIFFLLYP